MNTATEYILSLSPELQERIRKARLKLCVGQSFHTGYQLGYQAAERESVNKSIRAINKIAQITIGQ